MLPLKSSVQFPANNGLEALQVLTTMNYDSLADSPPSPSNPHWTAHTGPTDIQPQLSAVMVELITTQTAGSVIILAKGLAIYTTSDHGLFFSEVTVFQSGECKCSTILLLDLCM